VIAMSYQRNIEDKRRLKKLYLETKNSCIVGAYYDDKKNRMIRYSPSDNGNAKISTTKYLKRQSNKKIRRSCDVFQRGGYKKQYDYWWELY
jgi:hypothetical protein